jgi:DNA-directed RNA polymerase subunit RPC12/RpoP
MTTEIQQEPVSIVGKDPARTPCTCGQSMVVVQLPYLHCPSCHDTYRIRSLTPPVRCAHCDFNLLMWRRRHGFITPAPPFP